MSKILSQNVCYVAYPRSAQAYSNDAMDSNLGEPGKDINICLKFCLKMFVMLHIPEALRHTVMPRTPTWVNQEKISVNICLKFCLKMFVMLHIPEALSHTVMPRTPTWVNQEKISVNICFKFCLKMFAMLHIPEALSHTVMPWIPTWVNQEKISTFASNSVSKCLLCCISQKRSVIR